MDVLTGPLLVAAVLLVLAGGQKFVDPAPASGALRALRLPSDPRLVRAGAAAEVLLGAAAVVAPHPVALALVAAIYVGFAGFVVAAMRSGTDIASCGCFGREDTPPNPVHVVVDLAFAGVAAASALARLEPGDVLADQPAGGAPLVLLVVVATVVTVIALTQLPRTLALTEGYRR